MTWLTDRNFVLNEAASGDRALQFIVKMKEVLVDTAGWTLLGYGEGTAGSSDFNLAGVTWAAAPTFPAITGLAANAWICVENAGGVQAIFQEAANGLVSAWFSPKGAYTGAGQSTTVRPDNGAPPADELDFDGGTEHFGQINGPTATMTIAYTSDAENFIVFGVRAGKSEYRGILLKMEGFKTGDPWPYVFSWYARDNWDTWDAADLTNPAANDVLGWHPDDAEKEYAFSKVLFDNVAIMDVIPADPVSGDQQLLGVFCGCQIVGSYHIRGVVPGIMRAPTLKSDGDKYDSERWIQVGDWVFDGWNSSDALAG